MSSRSCESASRWRLLWQHVRQQALSFGTDHKAYTSHTCGSSLCLVRQPVREWPPHLISQCYTVTGGRQQHSHASWRVCGARNDAKPMTAHPHGAVQRKHICNRILYMLTNVNLQPDTPTMSAAGCIKLRQTSAVL